MTERILLVRLSAIGDVVHALHGLAALRAARPDARIGFLVEDRAASLLEGHPQVDRLHVFPRRLWRSGLLTGPARVAGEAAAFVAALRGERYGTAVDLQGNLKGGVLARLSGAPRRIGLAPGAGKEGNHRFQTEWVSLPAGPVHRVDRVLALLAPLGVDGPAGTPCVPARPGEGAEVDRFLAANGLDPAGFAVLHAGTSRFGEHKRWEAEGYGRVARGLAERRGMRSVASWGPGEEELADRVVRASDGAAIRGPRTPRLTALARLAERAGLFVAADTGALHLAAMLGTPTVGLYGPKDPRVHSPRGPRTTVVWKGVDCSPCLRRSCPDPVCMTAVPPGEVISAALRLIEEPVGSGAAGAVRGG